MQLIFWRRSWVPATLPLWLWGKDWAQKNCLIISGLSVLECVPAWIIPVRDRLDLPTGGCRPLELATTSFGQGISVTPLQQVMAVSAIANGVT